MWVTDRSPPAIPVLPLLSVCQCLHQGSKAEPSSLLIPSPVNQVPTGSEGEHAPKSGELPFWEREVHCTPPVQQAAAEGLLHSALSSPGTVPLLCPQSATPNARIQALHSRGTQPGGKVGTPMQDCTSDALACLRMQPVSPWQLGMLYP